MKMRYNSTIQLLHDRGKDMVKIKRNILAIGVLPFFFLLFCLGGSFIHVQADGAQSEKRVLFISSYSYAWDTVQAQIDGIQAGLGKDITLDFEFMDTKRVSDEKSMQLFYESLKYRLSKVEPYNVVILGDDAALQFALDYREELFADIPLVFEGINDEELVERAAKEPLVAGIIEKLSLESNIEFGMKINPSATKVVAILDDTLTGQAERKRYYECAEKYPQLSFKEINVSKLATQSLRYALQGISSDSILIYVVMTEDASGKLYTSMEAVKLIAENAYVPALRMVEAGIGDGLLGGNVVSMYKSGEEAAELALKFIKGISMDDMEVIMDSPNIYCVDAAVMEKHGISLSVLPKDTKIINYKESFLEKNRAALIPCSVLIVALILVLIWICIDHHRQKKMMGELENARKIMESASQHDFLTGLPNRSKFMSDLTELINEKKACTIMMLDIDDFKKINDSLGHTAGDEALQQVAGRLKDMESQLFTAYRFAGDEFIAILQSSQFKIVEKTAYACRQIFTKPFKLLGSPAKICGSIGIASYPKDTEDLEQLIVCADDAMYQVKKNGKNDFAFYKGEKSAE